jgi:fucose permease
MITRGYMLPIGYAAFVGLGLAATVVGVAWPFVRASFELGLDAVGTLLLAFTAGYLASSSAGRVLFGLLGVGDRIDALTRICLVGIALGAVLLWVDGTTLVGMLALGLTGLALAPVFPWLIAATPTRVGQVHAPTVVGIEIGSAVAGGAVLASGVGLLAARAGLEVLGPVLLACALAMLVLHLIWAR